MERVKPRELHVAARVADALVYAVGGAGVVAAGLLYRDGQTAYAVVAVALTFAAGAGLRLAAAVARAIAVLLVRTEEALDELTRSHGPAPDVVERDPDAPPDPYKRWGGWH